MKLKSLWAVRVESTVREVLLNVPDSLPVLLEFFGGCLVCKNFLSETLKACAEENHVDVTHVVSALERLPR